MLKPEDIARKFKSLAETSWDKEEYFNEENIKKKIKEKKDLFDRGHIFEQVELNQAYPLYLQKNKRKYSEWIIQ